MSVTSYSTGTSPKSCCVDGHGNIVIANFGSSTLTILNAATGVPISASPYIGSLNAPLGMVLDSAGFLWVVNAGSTTVAKISTTTWTLSALVTVGTGPNGIGYDAATNQICVTNEGASTLSIINATTNAVAATIALTAGDDPESVVSDGTNWWVSCYGRALVRYVTIATNTVAGSVAISGNGVGIAFDGTYVYVATTSWFKIDPVAKAVVSGFPTALPASCYSIALDALGNLWSSGVSSGLAYKGNPSGTVISTYTLTGSVFAEFICYDAGTNTVWIPDGVSHVDKISLDPIGGTSSASSSATGTLGGTGALAGVATATTIETLTLNYTGGVTTFSLAAAPSGICADGNGNIVLSNNAANSLTIMNAATGAAIAASPYSGSLTGPYAMCLDGSGFLWVTNTVTPYKIAKISTSTWTLSALVNAGISAQYGICYDAGSNQICVTNFSSASITIINAATNAIVTTIFLANPASGEDPTSVVSDGTNWWVSCWGSGKIYFVNIATNVVTGVIPSSAGQWQIAYDGAFVYTIGVNHLTRVNVATKVAVIEAAPNDTVRSCATDGKGTLWGSSFGSAKVYSISASGAGVQATIPIPAVSPSNFIWYDTPTQSVWLPDGTNSRVYRIAISQMLAVASASSSASGVLFGTVGGLSVATAGGQGALLGTGSLLGKAVATSAATGSPGGSESAAGTAVSTSSVLGTLQGLAAAVGTSIALSGASGVMHAAGALQGATISQGLAFGVLAGATALVGITSSISTLVGIVKGWKALAPNISSSPVSSVRPTSAPVGSLAPSSRPVGPTRPGRPRT